MKAVDFVKSENFTNFPEGQRLKSVNFFQEPTKIRIIFENLLDKIVIYVNFLVTLQYESTT